MGNFDRSSRLATLRKDCGHPSGGPSGELRQSLSRISAATSPGASRKRRLARGCMVDCWGIVWSDYDEPGLCRLHVAVTTRALKQRPGEPCACGRVRHPISEATLPAHVAGVSIRAALGSDDMIGKLKWTAILLVSVAILLGAKAFALVGASGHLGAPMAETCRRLSATAPHDNSLQAQLPEHCERLMAQVRAVSDENEGALLLTLRASIGRVAWGRVSVCWIEHIHHADLRP